MNGHPLYLVAVLAILIAVAAFAASRLLADRRSHLERTGKRSVRPPVEPNPAPPPD